MAVIKPFSSIRPASGLASSIAALPYDVYNRREAKEVVAQNPLSFLKIDRAETQFPDDTDMYSQAVYDRARETLAEMIADGSFIREESDCYYIYELTMDGRSQTGLVGCASIDDYENRIILKHENTRADKEEDRIRHVDTCSAQTGPIFLSYREDGSQVLLNDEVRNQATLLYDFISDDGVRHRVWKIDSPAHIAQISKTLGTVPVLYIADGHHRAASAVKVGLKRRAEHPDYDGSEEFHYFLSVLFPENQLHIYDYNRVVHDLNGYTFAQFLDTIKSGFEVMPMGSEAFRPAKKGEMGMYGEGCWYKLSVKPELVCDDPVDSLDVSLLQNLILSPVLGIKDPKTDTRIDFVGGIRGLLELQHMVDARKDGVAFAMYPTSMAELLAVADADRLMPPKSTWFEPKLRSGLFIHQI